MLKSNILVLLVLMMATTAFGADRKTKTVGNPVFTGWYADPEGAVFGKEYWIYPT